VAIGAKMNINVCENLCELDLVKKAINFAAIAHGDQKTPNGTPYLHHLMSVEHEVIFGMRDNDDFSDDEKLKANIAAILHDVIEDTKSTYDDLVIEFGVEIANGVLALSLDKSIGTKAEQIKDSLIRIKKQPRWLWCVKLGDRTTNMHKPPEKWDNNKKLMYMNDAKIIHSELFKANKRMADRLLVKIQNYTNYLN
jgi:(p)ppGpp synthase/HD superfamily hydrolase